MAETIVNIVLHKMADELVQEAFFLDGVRDKANLVLRELTRIQSFLKDEDTESHKKDERFKQWVNEIQEVVYFVDNVLDKFLAKVGGGKLGGLCNILKRIGKMPMKLIAEHKLGNEMHQILQRIQEISENRTMYGIYLQETSSGASIELPVPNPDIEMAETIVNLVLGKLADAVVQKTLFHYGGRDKVERVQRDLKWIRSFLKYANTKRHKDERVEQWVNEVQKVGNLIKDLLDKLSAEFGGGKLGGLRNILKRIGKIPMKLIAKIKVGNKIHQIQQRLCEISESAKMYRIGLEEASSRASIKLPVTNPDTEMAEHTVKLVLGKLADAVVKETLLLYGVCDKVEQVERDLKWMLSNLKEVSSVRHDEHVKYWAIEVQNVGYRIEDVLDKVLAEVDGARPEGLYNKLKGIGKMPKKYIAKHIVGDEIDQIQWCLREIRESASRYEINVPIESSRRASVKLSIRPFVHFDIDEMEVIGFKVDRKTIVDQLLDTNIMKRAVISIVGTGGIGKTTLAEVVYKSAEVRCHFSIFMWLTISQDYELIDILMRMLRQIVGELTLEMRNKGEEYLINELNKSMKERKYLVVLDDVWSSDVLTELEFALPNYNNGSRVLITSRFINIAKEIDRISKPHVIQPLNEEESKQLLLKKVFPNQFANEWPNDLLPLATQFTKKCAGWPLQLVVLGGILSKKNPDYATWVKLIENMDWNTHGRIFMDVISTSYEDLPAVLKCCFMFFGVFPENYQAKASTLIQLWIAEGFIQEDGIKSLEDIAESYLEELVQRCMVQVSRRSCIGNIKYCKIHNLLRELAIQKAKENNFLMVVSKNDTELSSGNCARRLAFHIYDQRIEHASTKFRSLISFGHVPNFNKFPTIRVLYISTEPCEYLPGTNYCQLPTGIKRSPLTYMYNLQMVHTLFCQIHFELHPSFWDNKQCRHIMLSRCLLCEGTPEGPPSAANLQSLLTLKWVRARQDWVVELPHFPIIQKLGIVIPTAVSGEILINLLSNLNYLGSLHLEMSSGRRMTFPSCISAFKNHNCLHSFSLEGGIWPRKQVVDGTMFPPNLVKLKLEYFHFEEDPMPQLEKLPNLRGLKLSGKIEAADGKQKICSTGGFAHLQGLLLEIHNLEEWKIEEGALPMLNQLVLKRCRKLQVVPDLQYLSNLQQLTVHHCLDQFNSRLQGEDKWKIKDFTSVSVFP